MVKLKLYLSISSIHFVHIHTAHMQGLEYINNNNGGYWANYGLSIEEKSNENCIVVGAAVEGTNIFLFAFIHYNNFFISHSMEN